MSLKERSYNVLIVSSNDNFNSVLSGLLPMSRYRLISVAPSISAAKRILSENTFDFIVINSPLQDDTGVRFAIDTGTTRQSVVLLLVKNELHGEIHDKVSPYGVFTLPKPTSKLTLIQSFYWLESARERLRQFEKKAQSIDEKMAEIRLVNKAKWLLISELKMSEPDAHHYIEKQAMNRCISKRFIVEEIIKTYS